MMELRITTWNINGIRNPFQYQPWRGKKTFAAMFDILEADIVVFQETKIQKKDLRDDMILVEGWDSYWSLPRYKKGYSGVVIYTRQSVCAPIRAEEGLTGILCPPNSSRSFLDLPEDLQIGGYPTIAQLGKSAIDAATIDSEGRCVILEFPAFVLLGVYSPATRDESRDEFRLGFLNLLDARIRNLISLGKRVILVGDLNVSSEELDTANAISSMRKGGLNLQEYLSMPSRRLFNQLLEDGKVVGNRDEGRKDPVLWDVCRGFHPNRKGMFTCWEQKVNARPGNCGSRIDYVLGSLAMKSWFSESNIQEGLMGSDHCPVYVKIRSKVAIDGRELDLLDIMNPPGMFLRGIRCRNYSTKDILPSSGRLIPQFDGRRSIRQMFTQGSSFLPRSADSPSDKDWPKTAPEMHEQYCTRNPAFEKINLVQAGAEGSSHQGSKRLSVHDSRALPTKRYKGAAVSTADLSDSKSQQSLKGFFKPKATLFSGNCACSQATCLCNVGKDDLDSGVSSLTRESNENKPSNISPQRIVSEPSPQPRSPEVVKQSGPAHLEQIGEKLLGRARTDKDENSAIHDPVESKDSWSRLFTKPAAPRCEGHNESCITLSTKKNGMNYGRSFWMCARPLGPTGQKERNTQWRCQTFIWCSDWNSNSTRAVVSETVLRGDSSQDP